MSLSCLGECARFNPLLFYEQFFAKDPGSMLLKPFLVFQADSDPLLRGMTALFIGNVMDGFCSATNFALFQKLLDGYITLIHFIIITVQQAEQVLISALTDSSSITSKMACSAVDICVNHLLTNSAYPLGNVALNIVNTLLSTSVSAYWLLKQEVNNTFLVNRTIAGVKCSI